MPHELTAPPATSTSVYETLRERCRELDLAAWRCDRNGSITGTPTETGLVGAWLGSQALRPHIQRAAIAWLGTTKPEVVEFFPGCWFLPANDDEQTDRDGVTIVLALGQEALEQEWFEVICAAAALDKADTRRALESHARYRPSDINGLVKILNWSQHDLARSSQGDLAIDQFSDKLIQAYEETNLLFRLSRYLNRISNPSEMMAAACGQICEILPFQWTAIQFNRCDAVTGELAGKLFVAGDLPCDRDAFRRAANELLVNPPKDTWTRLFPSESNELTTLVHSEIVLEPITHNGDTVVGGLLTGNKQGPDNAVSSVETQFLDATADFLSVFHQNVSRFAEQRIMFMGTLQALTASVDAKDSYTRGHSDRVALMAFQLATAMGMDAAHAERVRISGIVHDVGKIGVPEAVLCKTGRLTAEEFEQIKKHPTIGYNILKDIPPMKDVLPGVLHHHERWDGRGYPHGLSASEIPLFGRILALADTFDAMSSDRSYRSAVPRPDVLKEIRQCAGTQFDPELAELFVSLDLAPYDELIQKHSQE